MTSRDQRLVDAAIEVLGTSGTRRLTHRAVDAAAGVPLGSTSNRFRTREALLVGVLRRILELDVAAWKTLGMQNPITSAGRLTQAFGRVVRDQVEGARTLTQARRAIFVEAATNDALRAEIVAGRDELSSSLAPVLTGLGSADPEAHVRYLLALMDGLIGHQLAADPPGFSPETPIAALLRGLLH